eukprot:4583441-Ditylum_brightwellii.AAC.1
MENDELFQSDIKTENESDDKNDGSTPIQELVPAASSAKDQDFSAKLENKAARHQNLSSSRASSDKLPAICAVHDAQQAGNSSIMIPSYICMGQTGMSKQVKAILKNRKISHATAHEWMQQLGHKYKESTKCYYSDAHERDNV